MRSWLWSPLALAASLAAWACLGGVDAEAQCTMAPAATTCEGPKTTQEFIARYLAASTYDGSARPVCEGGGPTVVETQFRLLHMNGINQKLGIIILGGYLRTWWNDHRLRFNGTSASGCFDKINLAGEDIRRWAWVPDLYIDNLIERRRDATASSAVVTPDGTVAMTERVTLHVKSPLDLGKIPYDRHTATILMGSYSQDITRLRLTARGGTIGVGRSGVGISAERVSSSQWEFDGDGTFDTPGHVEVVDSLGMSFDMLSLIFDFAREPKFYLEQTIRPAILFTIVSYIQFWVDPALAPARSALAVTPVLIMLTLSSSMYESLPEGGERMWLTDNLEVLTFLCAFGALQFGFVQHCLVREKSRASKHIGLKSVAGTARLLAQQADAEGKSVSELLDVYLPRDREGAPTCNFDEAGKDITTTCRGSSEDAAAKGIKECDLLIMSYVLDIFRLYDKDDSDRLAAREVQKALRYFDIYISIVQMQRIVCMFLRDIGAASPEEEATAELTSTHFCMLLLDIDKYRLSPRSRSIRAYFQSIPASKRSDILARVVVPVFVVVQQIVMQLLLPAY